MQSVQIQIIGCLRGGKEGMFLSPRSKVPKLLLLLTKFVDFFFFFFFFSLLISRISGSLWLIYIVLHVSFLRHLDYPFYHDRFKDSYLNIMCAAGGGLCSSPTTWIARC